MVSREGAQTLSEEKPEQQPSESSHCFKLARLVEKRGRAYIYVRI